MRPNERIASCTRCATSASLEMSVATPIACAPEAASSAAAASALRMSAMTILAPSAASLLANALPSPIAPPVTMAVLPFRLMLFPDECDALLHSVAEPPQAVDIVRTAFPLLRRRY